MDVTGEAVLNRLGIQNNAPPPAEGLWTVDYGQPRAPSKAGVAAGPLRNSLFATLQGIALEIELEPRFGYVLKQPAECSQKHPLEMSSEGARSSDRGCTLRHPGESSKQSTWSQQVNNHRVVRDSMQYHT